MKEQDINKLIQNNRWVFAKTYAKKAPHEYLVKGKLSLDHQRLFEEFTQYIRDHGYTVLFWGKPFVCFDVGEHRYWTMGAPVKETIILNRAETWRTENIRFLDEKQTEGGVVDGQRTLF